MTDKLDMQSPDIVNENFKKITALFPIHRKESVEDKAIDFIFNKMNLYHTVVIN